MHVMKKCAGKGCDSAPDYAAGTSSRHNGCCQDKKRDVSKDRRRNASSSPTKRAQNEHVHYSLMIDDFAILETIGSGTFGKVKAGLNTITGDRVALKILNRAKMVSLDVVPKIKREIRLLARLDHPHVIRLLKVIGTPTDIFLIVEYASGGELFDYIVKRGTVMPVKDSRRFFQQIISGVKYCHTRGVVHRDLKPENLLLDDKLNIKIADFGLSNMLADGALLNTSCGSPNYAAPEVIQGRHYVGPEVDVWSCGIILYVLLAGRLPFDAPSVPQLFKLIEKGNFAIPKFVQDEAGDLLRRMICVDPLERATMDVVVHHKWFRVDLEDYLFPDDAIKPLTAAEAEHMIPNVTPTQLVQLAKTTKTTIDEAAKQLVANPSYMVPLLKTDKNCKSSVENRTSSNDSGIAQSPSNMSPVMSAKNPVRPCIPEGQAFCRPDCDLCPTWGATQCLFAHRITTLATCDLCPDHRRKGCLFSMEKLTLEDMFAPQNVGEDASFSIGVGRAVNHNSKGGHTENAHINLVHPVFSAPVEQQIKQMLTTRHRAKPKWHLGIRSGSAPTQIMMSLYNMLKALGYAWHRVNIFHLLVKMPDDQIGNQPLISMQLFRLPRASYLIDFRVIAPPDAPDDEEIDPTIVGLVHHKSSIVKYFNSEKSGHTSEVHKKSGRLRRRRHQSTGLKRISEDQDHRDRCNTMPSKRPNHLTVSSGDSGSFSDHQSHSPAGPPMSPGLLSPARIRIAHDSSASTMDWEPDDLLTRCSESENTLRRDSQDDTLVMLSANSSQRNVKSANPSTSALDTTASSDEAKGDSGNLSSSDEADPNMVKLVKLFGSALFDELYFDEPEDTDIDQGLDEALRVTMKQAESMSLMQDSVMKMEITPERELGDNLGTSPTILLPSPIVPFRTFEPNSAPIQGTDLPASHTLRYLDSCATMINKMMTGTH